MSTNCGGVSSFPLASLFHPLSQYGTKSIEDFLVDKNMKYIWEEDTDLVKNIDGSTVSINQFGDRYKTFFVYGHYMAMHELLVGLAIAYCNIKPEGEIIGPRPVYFVWRQKPECYDPVDNRYTVYTESGIPVQKGDKEERKSVGCRVTFYTENEYKSFVSKVLEEVK